MLLYPNPRCRKARWWTAGAALLCFTLGSERVAPAKDPVPAARKQAADVYLPSPAPLAVGLAPISDHPGTISGFCPMLPPVQTTPPRSTESFVDSLKANDASFEVVVGQGRLLTLKENLAVAGKPRPLIAVGDPTTIDFAVVGPRQLRIIGQRIGVTDLSITTADNQTYSLEVTVVADLDVLRCRLKAVFPDASLKLGQIRDHVVVEGEARDANQVAQILEMIRAYLLSVQAAQLRRVSGTGMPGQPGRGPATVPAPPAGETLPPGQPPVANVSPELQQLSIEGTIAEPRIINLIRVPSSQQVLLKVRVAELNRTALREIGTDFLGIDQSAGSIFGTQIGGAGGIAATGTILGSTASAGLSTNFPLGNAGGPGMAAGGGTSFNQTAAAGASITGLGTGTLGPAGTILGIFPSNEFEFFLRALRRNSVLKILAEPNLVCLNGHQASFLAGGEFPVPVPQVGASGVAPTITVQFREFGVRLGFIPYVMDDEVIRLSIDPEVSSVDFALGTTLVAGGSPVPGLNTRKAHTIVELRQGQTLAMAGLMQLSQNGITSRIPFLGDMPFIGPLFGGTNSRREEKELVVLVTPYLVEPMNPGQVPPTPGDEVGEPNDLELFLFNRIEGRTGKDYRSTTEWDVPVYFSLQEKLEHKHVCGPHGFSE